MIIHDEWLNPSRPGDRPPEEHRQEEPRPAEGFRRAPLEPGSESSDPDLYDIYVYIYIYTFTCITYIAYIYIYMYIERDIVKL